MNTDQLTTRVADQLGAQQRLLVAFSGGLDSSVLLHALAALRRQRPALQLRALHVHHGLSAFADRWVEHCRSRCADWQIPLTVTHVQVDARQGGIEAAARAARYAAFSTALTEGEALLTAQHLDDQSETFLLALKRGSGPAGLSAMAARAALGEHLLLRPLLGCSRQTLESYAQRHALTWIDDDSNQDTRFDRNFLRLQVLPQLNQRWPHFASAVARSAGLCAEQEQLLDELLAEPLQNLLAADRSLAIDGLTDCSPVRRFACCGAGSRCLTSPCRRVSSCNACGRRWRSAGRMPNRSCSSAPIRFAVSAAGCTCCRRWRRCAMCICPGSLTSRWRCRMGWGGLSPVRASWRCVRRSHRSGSAFVSAACRARYASWGAPIRGR